MPPGKATLAKFLTSLGFSFLVYEIVIIAVPPSS